MSLGLLMSYPAASWTAFGMPQPGHLIHRPGEQVYLHDRSAKARRGDAPAGLEPPLWRSLADKHMQWWLPPVSGRER